MGLRLRRTGGEVQSKVDYGVRSADYRVRITDCGVLSTDYGVLIKDYGGVKGVVGEGDYGLQRADGKGLRAL